MAGRPTKVVPDTWREVRLGEVAEVVGGSTPSRAQEEYWGGDIPWVAPSELTDLPTRYLECSREGITEEGLRAAGLRLLPAGSVLLTTRATIGVTAINTTPVTTNQGFQNLVGKGETDGLWLYYCISAMRGELERRGAGSTFQEVSRDSVRSLPILLPPLPEQRAIAAVLDSIDKAIERTDEVIAATERLRDALLHELLTRGLPGHHTAWRDVPGLGTIPASWEVVRLGDVAEVRTGRAVNRKAARSGGVQVPYLSVANVKDGYVDLHLVKTMQVSHDEVERYAVWAGDVLFTEGGDADKLGRGTVWQGELDPCLHQNHVFVARPHPGTLLPTFLSAFAASDRGRRYFLGAAKQTTNLASMNSTQLKSMRMPLPTLSEQRAIAATLDKADAAIKEARAGRDALQSMKASTADALLTGRVRISNPADSDAPKAPHVLESHVNRSEVLQTLRAHQATLAEQFGVTGLTLFGSVARDQATDASDIDILAEFDSAPGWREYFGAQAYLEGVLGRPVDLMTAGEVRPEIRPYVERDAISV